MNPEMFHDALNYIDDDMILAVDKLRHKKKSKIVFRRLVSVAACVCIVAISVFGIEHMNKIKEDTPLDENFETSGDKGDIPPATNNSQSTDNQPPIADESVPAEDQEKDETSVCYDESAPAEDDPPMGEAPPADEAPPAEEAPETHFPETADDMLILTVTEIAENGFKGYVVCQNAVYDPYERITVVYDGRETPAEGETVDVYFSEYNGNTVYAKRIFIVKE